jgi:hypothetical protein
MKEASEVELRCKIEDSPGPPAYIYWYKVRARLLFAGLFL